MVASGLGGIVDLNSVRVSIPFIAGQWSLLIGCRLIPGEKVVSIPFIAGQWSLQQEAASRARAQERVSIPFIAGQWSLRAMGR